MCKEGVVCVQDCMFKCGGEREGVCEGVCVQEGSASERKLVCVHCMFKCE